MHAAVSECFHQCRLVCRCSAFQQSPCTILPAFQMHLGSSAIGVAAEGFLPSQRRFPASDDSRARVDTFRRSSLDHVTSPVESNLRALPQTTYTTWSPTRPKGTRGLRRSSRFFS